MTPSESSLIDHIDLMVDEFKRIRALNPSSEILGLCDRALRVTEQNVPVIEQRFEGRTDFPYGMESIGMVPLYTHPASADKQPHWSQGSPGLADQYRQEAFAAREALGFSCDSLEVSPADIRQAIADKQAVSVPEWTDINLRQPEEYQDVLWFCQGGNIRTGMYYGKNHCDRVPETHPISGRGRSHYGKFGRYADPAESGHVVTHWMPLPQPPKQGQDHE